MESMRWEVWCPCCCRTYKPMLISRTPQTDFHRLQAVPVPYPVPLTVTIASTQQMRVSTASTKIVPTTFMDDHKPMSGAESQTTPTTLDVLDSQSARLGAISISQASPAGIRTRAVPVRWIGRVHEAEKPNIAQVIRAERCPALQTNCTNREER